MHVLPGVFVHGDLTVSNILHNNDFLFIDPRGNRRTKLL